MLLTQKKCQSMPNRNTVCHLLQDPPLVWRKKKRTAPKWVHVISMPVHMHAHTRTCMHIHTHACIHTHAHTHTEEPKVQTKYTKPGHNEIAISQLHSCFPPQNALVVRLSPRLLFISKQSQTTLQETCWMWKAKLMWGIACALTVGVKGGRLIM